jgi:hypothetical protein
MSNNDDMESVVGYTGNWADDAVDDGECYDDVGEVENDSSPCKQKRINIKLIKHENDSKKKIPKKRSSRGRSRSRSRSRSRKRRRRSHSNPPRHRQQRPQQQQQQQQQRPRNPPMHRRIDHVEFVLLDVANCVFKIRDMLRQRQTNFGGDGFQNYNVQ